MCNTEFKDKKAEYVGLSKEDIAEVVNYHNEIRAKCNSEDMMKMVNISS